MWTFLSIVFQTVFGVGIALLLHQALPGIAIFSRPVAVSLHRADGGDRAHLALDFQS